MPLLSKHVCGATPPQLLRDGYLKYECYKSHEAEDIHDIPPLLYDESYLSEHVNSKRPFIHQALHASIAQGRHPVKVCKERKRVLSILGRLESFEERPWGGPSARDVTRAGLYYLSHNDRMSRSECAFCCKEIRFRSPNECPWELHKAFSPYCRYLRTKGEHGVKPTPLGRKKFHHSTTSLHILIHGP